MPLGVSALTQPQSLGSLAYLQAASMQGLDIKRRFCPFARSKAPKSHILNIYLLHLDSNHTHSMETSPNTIQGRIVDKKDKGYIVEVGGERILFPKDMMLTVMAGLIARAFNEPFPPQSSWNTVGEATPPVAF
ncbi:hypothetical protein BT69DRAFT_475001 [Atractiella rhizophila]|nr:hypothetical protein BT69DRAFT_475001 [Atractiella rhizophila]